MSTDRPGLEWLTNFAWPLWLEHGVDWKRRGFNESLTLDRLESEATFRRLRVAARQTYVFSVAHAYGVPRAGEAVELGVAFLLDRARHPDGGYAWRLDLDGKHIDSTRDLYDHAFVLFALAAAVSTHPRELLKREALSLLNFLQTSFVHSAGGYRESLPEATPRRQNPHMHLLEALLAATEAFGDSEFLEAASSIVDLFVDRLLDHGAGALPEFFSDDLAPLLDGGRYVAEPGHHCEWIWLLDWYANLMASAGLEARPTSQISSRLQQFVDKHGIHPTDNLLFDGVWSDGQVHSAASRLWPQTERLKAERRRPDASQEGLLAAYKALEAYFTQSPHGLWHERRDEHGQFSREAAPASSLYHLTCGIVDLGRARPQS